MEIKGITDRHTFLTHPITEEILKLAKEHPDYPITVLVGEEANTGDFYWMYATSVSVGIEEILDCNSEWWNSDYVCTDREDLEDSVSDRVWDILNDELGREPTDKEQDEYIQKVLKAHEPYWKKVIAIKADN